MTMLQGRSPLCLAVHKGAPECVKALSKVHDWRVHALKADVRYPAYSLSPIPSARPAIRRTCNQPDPRPYPEDLYSPRCPRATSASARYKPLTALILGWP